MKGKLAVSMTAEELFSQATILLNTNFEEGKVQAEMAIQLALEQENYNAAIEFLYNLGRTYRFKGNGFLALEKLNAAQRLVSKLDTDKNLWTGYLFKEKGALYTDFFRDSTTAIVFSFKALNLNINELDIGLHINIGCQYINLNEFDKAEHHLTIAESAALKANDQLMLCYVYENGGNLFRKQKKYSDSIRLYEKGLDCADLSKYEIKDRGSVTFIKCSILIKLTKTYFDTNEHGKIPYLIEEGKKLSIDNGLFDCFASWMILEGRLKIYEKDYQQFKQLFNEGYQYCFEKNQQSQKEIWLVNMVHVLEEEEDYKTALEYNKKLLADKKAHEENLRVINLTSILENKEREISTLENENREIELRRQETEQFAYIMAHDLRTPLSNVSNFLGLFTKKYGDQVDPKNKEYLDFALNNSKVMHEMLDELLHYISIKVNESKIRACSVKLCTDQAASFHEHLIHAKNGLIEFGELSKVNMESKHLVKILDRLISNSIKFSHPNRDLHIQINAYRYPDSCTIEVIDNGIGIEQEYHHKIFDLFKRLDKVNFQGMGMGLSTCKKIINAYGGAIKAKNNDWGGTTIEFRIPQT